MKKFFTLLLAVASLTAVSCQKEQEGIADTNSEKGLVKVSFRAQHPEYQGDTKTVLSNTNAPYWSYGDHISVYDGTGFNDFESDLKDGDDPTNSAMFSGNIHSGATDFIAIYPYSANISYSDNKIVTTLPTKQYAVAGSFANQANVAIATGTSATEVEAEGDFALAQFTFSNVGALVKFTITQDNVHKGVTLKAFTKAEEVKTYAKIAGEIKISPSTAVAEITGNSEDAVSVEAGTGFLAAGDYYAVILPIEGQMIEFTFTDGTNTKKRSSQASITVNRSHFYDMGTIDEGISYSEPAPATGWIATELSEIGADDVFAIVGYDGEDNYALPNDNGTSAPGVVAVTVEDNKLAGTVADNIKWNVSGNATDGYTFYPNGDTESWLYCSTTASSKSNNNIKVGTGDRKVFVLDSDNYLVTNDTYTARYLSIYVNSGTPQDWRGYTSNDSAVEITFFKYFDAPDTRDEAGMSWSADSADASIEDGDNIIFSAPTLTVGNATNIAYNSTAPAVASIDTDGNVTILAEGTTTIQAIFAGDTNYKPQTVGYTLTVTDNRTPVVSYDFESVAELNGLVTSTSKTYSGYLTDAVVSFVAQTNTAFVTDGTGSVMIYKSSHGLKQGQTYTGEIEVTAVKYNGLYSEITDWKASFTGDEATVDPAVVELSALVGHYDDYQNAYVQISGLTVSSVNGKNINVTDGANDYLVYDNTNSATCVAGDVITAVGTITKYETTEELKVWKNTDITVTASAPKAITFTQPASGGSFTVSVAGSSITSGTTVASGTTVTLTATPATDYAFVSWTVTGATVADASSATTTFEMGTSAVTVSATFTSTSGGGGGGTSTTYTSTLTFTAKCNGSGTADDDAEWTVTSDGTESNFDSSKGIHYGTSSGQVQYISLRTSDIPGTITKVVVNASTASGVNATVAVTVGGDAFGGDPQSLGSSAKDYTFTGSASGVIVVTVTKPTKAAKALYVKSIVVTYEN